MDVAETNLLPARSASGTSSTSGSHQPVLEVQHQLAQLAGVLLRRIGPAIEPARSWSLPLEMLQQWDADTEVT